MDEFFRSNPGMSSRIAHHIDFPDYSVEELDQIGLMMAEQLGYRFSEPAREALHEYLEHRKRQPRFANARSVRNAVERARLRQARRLMDGSVPEVGRDDLTTLESEDLRGSRVFAAASEPDVTGDE
jgi:hypothetical protein